MWLTTKFELKLLAEIHPIIVLFVMFRSKSFLKDILSHMVQKKFEQENNTGNISQLIIKTMNR